MLSKYLRGLRAEYADRSVLLRELAMYTLLLIGGWNDATPGALLPSIQRHYNIDFVLTSTLFICSFAGSIASAAATPLLVDRFGFGRSITIFAALVLAPWLTWVFVPPFPVFALGFVVSGLAVSSMDSLANAWMTGRPRPALRLGALHFAYGLGALLSPLAAIPFNDGSRTFSHFYILALCLALTNLILVFSAFRFKREQGTHGLPEDATITTELPQSNSASAQGRAASADISLRSLASDSGANGSASIGTGAVLTSRQQPASPALDTPSSRLRQVLKTRDVYVLAVFTLFYVGCEVSIGGWTSSYLLHQDSIGEAGNTITVSQANALVAGFWAGIAVGRIVMIPLTGLLGGRFATLVYLAGGIALQVLVWRVPHIATDAVTLPLLGMLLGPLYPVMIEVASQKIRPRSLHTAAIAFIGSFGACGSALFPFAIGLVAQRKGIEVLPPILTVVLAAQLLIWLFLWGFRNRPVADRTD